MPCDTRSREQVEQDKRDKQMSDLMAALKAKTAAITKAGGVISITGWANRGGWCDECAIRSLRQSDDFEIRRIVAAAVPHQHGVTFGHAH